MDYKAELHHILPVKVLADYASSFQQLFPGGGQQFGMKADFTARLPGLRDSYYMAQAYGRAEALFPGIVELPANGFGRFVEAGGAVEHAAHPAYINGVRSFLGGISDKFESGVLSADVARAQIDYALRNLSSDLSGGRLPLFAKDASFPGLTSQDLGQRTAIYFENLALQAEASIAVQIQSAAVASDLAPALRLGGRLLGAAGLGWSVYDAYVTGDYSGVVGDSLLFGSAAGGPVVFGAALVARLTLSSTSTQGPAYDSPESPEFAARVWQDRIADFNFLNLGYLSNSDFWKSMGVDSSFGVASPISAELQHANVTAADVAAAGSAYAATLMLQQDYGNAYALYAINNTFVTTTNTSSPSSLGLSSDWFNSSASSYTPSLSIDSSFSYTPSWASAYPTDWWNASFYSLPSWSSNSDPYSNYAQSNATSSYYGQYSYSPSYTASTNDWWSNSWGSSTFSDYNYNSYNYGSSYNYNSSYNYSSNSYSSYNTYGSSTYTSYYTSYDYSYGSSSYSSFGLSFPPVVLDLAGNGIDITPLTSSNFFVDAANNGHQQRVAWAGTGDGVLVYSPDGGPITQANQFQFTLWDPTARTDLEALQHVFDGNHDNVLNANDSSWSSFRILVTNADGTTTLKTLAEAGVTSINLQANAYSQVLSDGSSIEGQTTFTRSDGSKGTAATARFASEGIDYRVQQAITTNPDGSKTLSNSAYDLSGVLAEKILTSTSADGLSRTVASDWNGDGVVDQTQTDLTTVTAGVTTKTVTDVDGTGTLLDKTTRTTSADKKTVSIARDTTGAGYVSQVEVDKTNADGSTSVAVTNLTRNGGLISGTNSTVSTDGLRRTLAVDSAGTGYDDLIETDITVVAADGTRTETVTDSNSDGSMRSRTVTVTSGDGLTINKTSDQAGNGIFNLKTTDTTVVGGNGIRTTTHVDKATNNSVLGRTRTTISADGRSTTTEIDHAGNNTYDLVQKDEIVIDASGNRTETVTSTAANQAIYAKQVSTRNVDGKTGSTSVYQDIGDGLKLSQAETKVVNASGQLVDTVTLYSSNQTVIGKTVTITSADGLTSTTEIYPTGSGSYISKSSTETVKDAAGASVTTDTRRASNGTLIGKTVTKASADGTSTVTQQDSTGDGIFDSIVSYTKTHNPDGTIGEVVSTTSGNGAGLGRTVTVTSADRSTVKTTTINGDGETVRISTFVTGGDGSVTVTTVDYAPDMMLIGRTVQTTSANGLSISTQTDIAGTGTGFSGATTDATVINANGSRTQTVSDTSGNGTLIDCTITTTSANGLTSVQTTKLDDKIDYTTTDAKTFNSDGSVTERVTVTNANDGKLSSTLTTVSGNGLSTTTSTDADGDGTTDVTLTDVIVLNADGGRTETVTSVNGTNGSVRSKIVSTVSASGASSVVSQDTAGRGFFDQEETVSTLATGVVTDTLASYGSAGQLLSKTVTTTSATGLSVTTATDVDGDNDFDRTQIVATTYDVDGSTTETTTSKAGTATAGSTVQTTSANGLTVTSINYGGAGNILGSTSDITVLNIDGSTKEIESRYSSSGAVLARQATTLSSDGKTTIVQKWTNGNDQEASKSISALQADGSVVSTVSTYLSNGDLTAKTVKTTAANGLSSTVTIDKNGDGVTDDTQSTATVLNADGSTVETFIDTVADGSSATKVVTTTLANGLSKTVATTGAIKSIADNNTLTDTTVINNDGSKTETRKIVGTNWNGATLNWSKATSQTSGNGLSTSTTLSAATDTFTDFSRQEVTAVDGSTTTTTTLLRRDGSAFQTDVLTTSATGLSSSLQSKRNGATAFNYFETKITNGDGSLTDTIWETNAAGTTTYKSISTTSADGLVKTIQAMPSDASTVGSTIKDITTLNADGTTTNVVSDHNGAGQLQSKTVRTTSVDGLSVTTTADVNGDGSVDETTTDVTALNANGSRTQTVTTKYASGTQKSQSIVTTSGNGLSVTTDTTIDGYTKTTKTKTTASNGIQTETLKRYKADGTTLASSIVTTTSADGNVTVITQKNGSGTVTQTETITVQANAFGSYNWIVRNGSGTTQYQATHLFDANGVDRVSLTIGSSTYQATLTKEQEGDLRAKVGRMYDTVLGRGASRTDLELALKNYSSSGLNLTTLTTTTLASSEFSQKYGSLSDVQFIERIYQNALGRGASLTEVSTWLGQLTAQTTTRASLAIAVSEGSEHVTRGNSFQETNNTYSPDGTWSLSRTIDTAEANTIVGGLYQATLGRVASTGDLSTYSTALLNGTKTEAQIVAALIATSEFATNFGSLPNQVFVGRVFVDALNRPPSEAESQLWTSKLAAGLSKADFILAIANTPESGSVTDNGNGTEQRLVYSVNPSDVWQSQSQLWQKATTTTASANISSKDWVTTTTQVWVTEGHDEIDESGVHWVDTSHWVSQTTTAQQTRSHVHSVVTQKDSVELSVTTVANNGASTTTPVTNSPGDEAWTQIILTYEGGNLLDTIATNDNGTRSITINRGAGSDVFTGGSTDAVRFAATISYNQLWFSKSGNNLLISVIGQDETMTLTDWYVSPANQPASIVSGDGYSLTYAGINSLVQSMAGQLAPVSGTNGITLIAAPTPVLAQDTSTNKGITSNGQVNVSGLVAGASWQYSLNGGVTWAAGSGTSIAEAVFGADGAKTVQIRQADSRGNFSPVGALSFTLDNTEATPTLALATDTSGSRSITSNGLINVFGLGLGGTWEYSLNGTTWSSGSGSTIAAASLGGDGLKTVRVRQTDIAKNTSAISSLAFTLDTSAPAPTVGLVQDTSGSNKITSNGQVNIGGLVTEAVWEYSMDGGQSWAVGAGSSIAAASFGADGSKTVKVRQTDVAGNVSGLASLTFVLATAAATPILELVQDTSHGQGFSSNGQINISQLAPGGTWQYSLNNGSTWETGVGTSIATAALGGNGAKTVRVKQTDAAGNNSAEVSLNFTLDTAAISPSLALTQDTSSGKLTTSNGQVNVSGLVGGASWKYSLDGGQTWVAGAGTTIAASVFGLDGYKNVQVRQTETNSNTSPTASFAFTLAHGTPIYAFGEAIGETFDNGNGTQRRVDFNTSRTGGWAYQDHLWQNATTLTATVNVSSKDWVTTPVWVDEGHWETDESGSYWVDTSHWGSPTIAQQTQSHSHSVVTQKDAVELSVTTASTNGTLTTAAGTNSEQPWSQIIKTYEAGILLDKITISDNGTRSIEVSRAAGADTIVGSAADAIIFGSGISYNQLWFNQTGSDLTITVIGQNETLTLSNWYASASNHVGSIQSGDGYTISDAGVQNMVQAMVSLAPPSSGQTTLPAAMASQLAIPLSTNWHHT